MYVCMYVSGKIIFLHSMYDDDHMNFITSEVDTMMNNFSKDDNNTGVLLDEFSVSEISKICKAMPNGKAPGYDLISYETSIQGIPSLASPHQKL